MGAVLIFILMALLWVVLIVPRQREVRRHNALVASLEVGDEVMTGAGIYGTITELGDDEVSVEIAPGVIVRMVKRAVGSKIEHDPSIDLTSGTTDHEVDGSADEPSELNHSQIDRTED
ncbi:MAG: preprotein translocase subunit YajC [Acidimicrobiales bacterium]